jgi:hypothetical protein
MMLECATASTLRNPSSDRGEEFSPFHVTTTKPAVSFAISALLHNATPLRLFVQRCPTEPFDSQQPTLSATGHTTHRFEFPWMTIRPAIIPSCLIQSDRAPMCFRLPSACAISFRGKTHGPFDPGDDLTTAPLHRLDKTRGIEIDLAMLTRTVVHYLERSTQFSSTAGVCYMTSTSYN